MPKASASGGETPLEKRLVTIAVGAGAAAAIIGAACLFRLTWAWTSSGSATTCMESYAALCALFLGMALALAIPHHRWAAQRVAARLLAGSATALAILTVAERIPLRELPSDSMGIPEAVTYALCGLAILLLTRKYPSLRLVQSLGLGACVIALFGVVVHLYGLQHVLDLPPKTAIPPASSVAAFLLGAGLVVAAPRGGFVAVFTAGTPGAVASRRLLLPALFLPIILGWFRLQGEVRGMYGLTFGTSLLVISWIVIFSFVVYQVGKRAEAEQRAVEEARSQEFVRESERRLRDIIDNMNDAIVVVDPGTGALYWNRKAIELYDLEPDGKWISFLEQLPEAFELRTLDGEVVPWEQWPLPRVLRGEEFGDLDLLIMDKRRNRQRTFTYSGRLTRSDGDASQLGVLTVRDITARKEKEEALRHNEELLRNVLEALPVAVWILAADGTVLQANKAALEIWGDIPKVGMEKYHIFKGWRLDTGERIADQDWAGARAILRGEASYNEKVLIETFDGSHKIIRNSAIPLFGSNGEVSGAVTVNQDITVEKQAEEALRASVEKFGAVFQQAAVGMGLVTFTDERWVDVNDAFCEMLGFSHEEMRAKPWPEMTHPEDLDLDLVPFRRMAAGELQSYSVEKRFIHKDGHHVWARLTLSLVRDSQGRPDYEIAIIEDITSRKEAQEALRRARDELELRVRERTRELEEAYAALQRETDQRLAAVEDLRGKEQLLVQQSRLAVMGEMLGNIAHQWRQPLNTLGLLIQHLQLAHDLGQFSGDFLREEVAKGMKVIRHMSQTISDFKDFLKEEKEVQPFSVNGAVVTTLSLLEAPLKALSVKLEIDQASELTVTGHRNEFSHVILNLITNARDAFAERGIEAPRIVIRIFKEDGNGVVTVTDNAGGIPEEILGRIFEPYFTTKGPEKGTGIGLYMAKNIIEKSMGGVMSVRNTGYGAEFRIELRGR